MLKKSFILTAAAFLIVLILGIVYIMNFSRPENQHMDAHLSASETPAPTASAVPSPTPDPWVETIYPPTCEQAGYTLRENTAEGYSVAGDEKPALGHDLAEWKLDAASGQVYAVCSRCGKQFWRGNIDETVIPQITFTGSMEGIGKKERVILGFSYKDGQTDFDCYSYTSLQGHSTLNNEKKNYTVRLFDDQELISKHRLNLRPNWQYEHKYILKANYWDVTLSRNLIGAHVWAQMAAARPNLPSRLRDTSNFGAVDGFPVAVYLNDSFFGLYTLCLHKDDDLYGMRYGDREAVMICNAQTMDEALFRAEAAFQEDVSDWEIEFCGTEDDNAWVKEKFNAFIRFVMTSDDETFRRDLRQYLDVDGAMDYLIFLYALGLTDSAAKDLVLLCYDDVWIPSVYDMEDAFGLNADGSAAALPDTFLPSCTDGVWFSGTDSLLWDRLLQNFSGEITARYRELRGSVLSQEALTRQVNECMDAIPEILCQEDLALYPNRTPLPEPRAQILNYIRDRLPLLDQIFEGE